MRVRCEGERERGGREGGTREGGCHRSFCDHCPMGQPRGGLKDLQKQG